MLSKLLALWIIVLAVSPFTEPFATCKIGGSIGTGNMLTHRRTSSDPVCGATLHGQQTKLPNNPPVDARSIVNVHARVRILITTFAVETISLHEVRRTTPLNWARHQGPPALLARPLAVLRL